MFRQPRRGYYWAVELRMSGQSDAQLKKKLAVRWIEMASYGSVAGRRHRPLWSYGAGGAALPKLKHSEALQSTRCCQSSCGLSRGAKDATNFINALRSRRIESERFRRPWLQLRHGLCAAWLGTAMVVNVRTRAQNDGHNEAIVPRACSQSE